MFTRIIITITNFSGRCCVLVPRVQLALVIYTQSHMHVSKDVSMKYFKGNISTYSVPFEIFQRLKNYVAIFQCMIIA